MNRRDFTKAAVLGTAGAALLGGCGPDDAPAGGDAPAVQTQPTVRWRLVSSFPKALDTIYAAAQTLAARVAALTDGRFQIRPYAAGELVPALEVLGAVQQGTAQMGHSASYYYVGKNPALAFDTCVPFGLTARQYNAWIYEAGGRDLLRGLFADFGVVNLPGGNTGMQMGGWFRRPIEARADLRDLSMRIPGLGGRVMDALGVNVQVLDGGEVVPALERGTIDAAEWVGPYDDEKLGFHEVAPFYYYPGWWEPGPALSFYVNQRAWEGLPTTYRDALAVAADAASVQMLARYDAKNPAALQRLLDAGTTLRRFPDDVMRAARAATRAILEEQAAADPAYRRLYDAHEAVRRAAYRWFGTAEAAYAAFAYPDA